MIKVKNITKIYGKKDNQFKALNDVSFDIPDGASVAIVGKSGSGKSTLMHVMSSLDSPDKGEVFIGNKDILSMKPKRQDKFRAEMIGFVFQSFFVQANETSAQNVALPLEIAEIPYRRRDNMANQALRAVDLMDKKKAKANELSGGQKQRLAIARAIVNRPKILFADEPTGNLDSMTSRLIEDLLFSYNKEQGATLIIVTHDEDLAAKCDMKIYIKDGEVEKIETASLLERGAKNA